MMIIPVLQSRAKNIEIDYYFIREKVAVGQLITRFILFQLQIADVFTKPLFYGCFCQFHTKLSTHSFSTATLKGA